MIHTIALLCGVATVTLILMAKEGIFWPVVQVRSRWWGEYGRGDTYWRVTRKNDTIASGKIEWKDINGMKQAETDARQKAKEYLKSIK